MLVDRVRHIDPNKVVLPLPDGPTMAMDEPFWNPKVNVFKYVDLSGSGAESFRNG